MRPTTVTRPTTVASATTTARAALLSVLVLATPLAGCSSASAPTGTSVHGSGSVQGGGSVPSGPPRVSGTEAKQLVAAGAILLDVRTEEEFADGHIEGARNLPVGRLRDDLASLPKDKPIVVYCAVGARSASAAATLHAAGYQVKNLGAMANWNQ